MFLSQIIQNSSRDILTIYIFCSVAIIYGITSSFEFSITSLIAISAAIYFIYDFGNSYTTSEEALFRDTEFKIKYLDNILQEGTKKQKTTDGLRSFTYIKGSEASVYISSFLYTDPDCVRLLYSIRDYEVYAPKIYFKVLFNINILLKLKNDFSLKTPENKIAMVDCYGNFRNAEKIYKNILNYFHSFVYSLPVGTYYRVKNKEALKKINLLMKRNMDYMKNICEQKYLETGIKSDTHFIGAEYDGVKFYDKDEQTNFHMYV